MSRIFSLFLLLFISTTAISYAEEDVYFIENVDVNVSGKNPAEARTIATETARKDALLILLARLNLDLNIADHLTGGEISDMVKSEQINNEKIAGNNYSASFNITFAEKFVNRALKQNNVKKAVAKVAPYLLLPAKNDNGKIILWEKNNDWKKSMELALSKQPQNKFFIPEADMDIITVVNGDNVKEINYNQLESIITKNNILTSYILLFSFDEIENKAVIDVIQINKMQKNQNRLSFVNVNRLSYQALLDKVADKVVDYLSKQQIEESKITNLIKIEIINSNLGNWLMVKNKIENSNLVDQINIESISQDRAVITVNYINPNTNIEESFSKIGLNLQKNPDNSYKILIN